MAVYSALALLCVLLTSRWWLPAALPRLLALGSVEVASVERLEMGGLRLSDLVWHQEGLRVEADWIEVPSEWLYLQERFFKGWSGASMVRIGQMDVRSTGGPAGGEPEAGSVYLPQIHGQVLSVLASIEKWLPTLQLNRLSWSDGSAVSASAESVAYRDRRLSGSLAVSPLAGRWQTAVSFEAEAPWRLEFSHSETDLTGGLELRVGGETAELEGHLDRAGSQLDYDATFGDSSWLPLEADARTEGFAMPEIRLPLVSGLSLASLQWNRLEAQWDGRRYRFDAAGQTTLQTADEVRQSVAFELSGSGDFETILLEQAALSSDWANLRLSEPLEVDWRRRSFTGEARLRADLDLGGQPWLEAEGRVEAELSVAAESPETVRFTLRASDLTYADYAAQSLEAEGWSDFTALHLDSLVLRPAGADAEEIFKLSGAADLDAATVDLEFSALLGAEWLNTLAGQDLFVAVLEVRDGELSGAWNSPEVSAKVETTLQAEASQPIGLSGAVRWDGANSLGWAGVAWCGGAEITIEASAAMANDAYSLRVESLRWTDPERPELYLEAPFQLRWKRVDGSFKERLSFSAVSLRGEDLEASATCGPAEGLKLILNNISLARVGRWLRADLPGYHVDSLAGTITDFRPFVLGSVQIAAKEQIDADTDVRLELSAELGERFIDVTRVSLRFEGEDLLAGDVRLPLRLRLPEPATEATFYVMGRGALGGHLKGQSTPAFSQWLQAGTGLRLERARLDMDLVGDWSQPAGHLNLQVEEVGLGPIFPEVTLPNIQDLDLRVQADEGRIDVETLNFSLNKSAVQASLRIPVDAFADSTAPIEWLRAASGTLRLDQWEMEDWVDWMPPYLRRSGRLTGSVRLEPPLDLSGTLRFEDFGLRPTGTLAAVDQIGGRIRLAGRVVQVEEAAARLGGSRVGLSGQIDFSDWEQPRWSFDVSGRNVPIRRTTEMILRSDLDIRLASEDTGQAPLLSGNLRLRSSTLLVDFDPLAPRLKKGTAARAPFFRITEEPYANWRFDLTVTGDSFMRVRSPYFKSQLSADLRLKGTFAEPELLGSIRTLGGDLRFPGAKFVLDEGEAYIEPSRPNTVQINFSGIAQKASRVIVMEVSQTLEDPLIQFQSTPPMSQADIVRLLATGSTTGGGVGNLGIYLGQGMLGAGGMNDGFADRLSVDLGGTTTRSGGDTIGARYELSPSWSVEGEYDVYDAYNVDLIWSIFQR